MMRNSWRLALAFTAFSIFIITLWQFRSEASLYLKKHDPAEEAASGAEPIIETDELLPSQDDKILVMAKLKTEDTEWVAEALPDWQRAIYHVDEPEALLHVPLNKGREAMAYLTYMIDNYDKLPTTIAFIHPHNGGWPAAWHTDTPGYSNAQSLNTLRIEHVQKEGYVNLRCIHNPGCPDEMQPFREPYDETRSPEHGLAGAWIDFFGGDNSTVPRIVAEPCCSQFAVSRDQVRKRSRQEWTRYRQWLLETTLTDYDSGRIMEYLWHVFFWKDPVHCPDMSTCYCEVYGRC